VGSKKPRADHKEKGDSSKKGKKSLVINLYKRKHTIRKREGLDDVAGSARASHRCLTKTFVAAKEQERGRGIQFPLTSRALGVEGAVQDSALGTIPKRLPPKGMKGKNKTIPQTGKPKKP